MIFLASDIHGHIRLNLIKRIINKISKNDYLLILGDAGIVWEENNNFVLDFYKSLPCKTLFIDGNHENFTLLNRYPITEWNEGRVHNVADNVYHLLRGEVYIIDNKKCFAFGGGFSAKRVDNTSPVFIWEEEMPNEQEYQNAKQNLKKANNQIDYVFSHVAPTLITNSIGFKLLPQEKKLNDFLEDIMRTTSFHNWFFGHYHKDFQIGKFHCVFEEILQIGENK